MECEAVEKKLTLDVLRKLPKAELHLHLDGSARIQTLIDLAKEQEVELPSFTKEGLGKLIYVDETCQSLVEYLRGFDITLKVLQKPYAITRVMYEVCEDAVADGVRYLEVRFSPILHIQQGMSLSQVMEAICEGKTLAEYRLPICANIIVCGMRHLDPSDSKKLAEIAWRYKDKGVVGFDLAGPENGFRSKAHKEAFDIIHKNHINCTLHAGEAAGPESIQDSIRWCGAHRIGHGVALKDDDDLLNFVVDHRIPIETCITSNLHTKAIKSLKDHPMRKFFDSHVPVVPCTDNKTVSNITLSEEYLKYCEVCDFTVEEVVRMIDYGFNAAFIGQSQKQRLRAEVLSDCVKILSEEGYDVSKITNKKVYWDRLGVDFSAITGGNQKQEYWGHHKNPAITLDMVKSLPKADLHCRIDGSVSISHLWDELTKASIDLEKSFGLKCNCVEELKNILYSGPKTEEKHRAKKIFNSVLQTKEQLERAVVNILDGCIEDNVKYVELMIRPRAHIKQGLSEEEVLKTVIDIIGQNQNKNYPKVGLAVYASVAYDSPTVFDNTANLAIKYKNNGVCGFGVLGSRELKESEFEFFQYSFDNLKRANMNVVIFSGHTNNIQCALQGAGANRISGAFQVHQNPSLMDYMGNHGIAVELGLTDMFRIFTSDTETFTGNPIRLFLDNHMPVTICSFKGSTSPKGRSEVLYDVISECNLSPSEYLNLITNGFKYNFQSFNVREKMVQESWKEATNLLKDN
eukprot:CAMPEP_0174262382 /NCGR_PEP_ID=MMETSP0439-20130205/12941_1 /TAXON_ID=0 /ORGANISM="Stereomyxa ramosa, Strain Chinc5" /LENGTH=743 /DNA_ID=CAMNT_0015347079 /DNA_START=173 /DNA_END=2401 /DNA_ORIENTATION=-